MIPEKLEIEIRTIISENSTKPEDINPMMADLSDIMPRTYIIQEEQLDKICIEVYKIYNKWRR